MTDERIEAGPRS
jgi:hypothetical protein